jgi:hypothetical protein
MRRDCQRNWNQGRRDWNSTNFKRNWTLENTEGAIKNGQSRETGVIGHTIRRQAKQKQNKIQQHNVCSTRHKQTQIT